METSNMTTDILTADNNQNIQLEESWRQRLLAEFDQDYMKQLKAFLLHEKQSGKVIYPNANEYFNAFNLTPFNKVRVVVIGQDPYHGPNQAHGLSFSVQPSVAVPPSLKNIFKEIKQELGLEIPNHGCLKHWAQQGVLLLNAVLTVEQNKAAAHQGKGWERFTDAVIYRINEELQDIVFLLWGAYAQKKGNVIDTNKHLVLTSPHPSPLSAHRGFLGNGHFKQCNDYLLAKGYSAIDWSVPE